ncbi:hypothetical protein RchiOBHm_Chr5g0020161 [Rosa chinensis]|uniref:Uncharacterized protein n=1 Tax=Rosa chinensis TaxID=74649 RepID=A0A2P6Q784_ROSCH|nr:hypothetical protein RchiOBHm_Chr5g0020161 [Rosa chinensis]
MSKFLSDFVCDIMIDVISWDIVWEIYSLKSEQAFVIILAWVLSPAEIEDYLAEVE